MTDIRWEDPPPATAGRGSAPWAGKVEPLRTHPKRWAILATFPTSRRASTVASNLRSGHFQLGPGRWEFAARTADGEHRVYGRYLGPDEDGGS